MKYLLNRYRLVIGLWAASSIHVAAQIGEFEWAVSTGGSTGDNTACTAGDAFGNVYLAGTFSGTVDFDPGPGVYDLNALSSSFIQKLDQDGELVWAKVIAVGLDLSYTRAVMPDSKGNVYVSGHYSGTLDFDSEGAGLTPTSNGLEDAYIVKYDPQGNFLWMRSFGGPEGDVAYDLAVDKDDNLIVSGHFEGLGEFFPDDPGFNLTAVGDDDVFVMKFDPDGAILWAHSFGSPNSESSLTVDVTSTGEIYLGCHFRGTIDFDPGPATHDVTSNNFTIGIVKLNPDGTFIWARHFSTGDATSLGSLATDSGDNVVLLGSYQLQVDLDPGPGNVSHNATGNMDFFVVKLDGNGEYVWGHVYGGYGFDWAVSLDCDGRGNAFGEISFQREIDFQTDSGEYTISAVGDPDIVLIKWDRDGNIQAIDQLNGFLVNSSDNRLSVDPNDNILVGGEYNEPMDLLTFGSTDVFNPLGWHDLFIIKLSQEKDDPEPEPGDETVLEMPNAFTPNNDGVNDFFEPVSAENVQAFEIRIFNRWGSLVYEGQNSSEGWDGTFGNRPCTEGTYFWVVQYHTADNKQEYLEGSLTLMR